jgi:hypothetical protein
MSLSKEQTIVLLKTLLNNVETDKKEINVAFYPLIYEKRNSKYDANIQTRFVETVFGFPHLTKDIRNVILASYYVDLDIQNCHPVLLYHYADK